MKEFYCNGSQFGSLTRLGCEQSLYPLNLVSGGGLLILMSFSGSFNPASSDFLAASLISNCLNSLFGTQGMAHARVCAGVKGSNTETLLSPGRSSGVPFGFNPHFYIFFFSGPLSILLESVIPQVYAISSPFRLSTYPQS